MFSTSQGAPRQFVLFLQALVKRNRHMLLREIAGAYHDLLDLKLNRVRAAVTLAASQTPNHGG